MFASSLQSALCCWTSQQQSPPPSPGLPCSAQSDSTCTCSSADYSTKEKAVMTNSTANPTAQSTEAPTTATTTSTTHHCCYHQHHSVDQRKYAPSSFSLFSWSLLPLPFPPLFGLKFIQQVILFRAVNPPPPLHDPRSVGQSVL
ncbi:MAG: hypothetical protein J3Q66DRAFT_309928 [Benniella sp.]|nr:MAG: hypothetical protein J3Q66DRAFT_309928 [Benniella sp.]